MAIKKVMCSCWILMLVAVLDTISQGNVECLQTLDKNNFGPKPKRTIKTIEVPEDGDMIDCVDIYHQPSFSNQISKDLEMTPSASYVSLFNRTIEPPEELIQNWHKYGECPEGTIPIRRPWNNTGTILRKTLNYESEDNREYAIATQEGSIYQGAEAFITLWNPKVRGPAEFSLSQIWVASGPNPVNTIEVGWTVFPKEFHDSQTRLFTYWTQDSYIRTGCYNLDCPGFVQTNRRIALGGALRPTSVYGRESYDIHINIARDRETDKWWIKIAGETLGYFPSNHFNSLRKGANLKVDFGGEIINNKDGNRHTATQMGSGHFATEGLKKSSLIRNIKVVNNEYDIVDASLEPDVTIPECYNLHFGPPETSYQTHFYFGGPGYSDQCP